MLSLLNTTFTNTLRQGSTLIGSLLSKLKARSTYFENKTCTKNTLGDLNSEGLLEKASIVTTPTAYSDGFLHSVKPEQTLGSELVTNGDFSNGDTDWVLTTPWSVSDGKAFYDFSTAGFLRQLSVFNGVIGTLYNISFDISDTVGIKLGIKSGNTFIVQEVFTNGSYSFVLPVLSNDTDLRIYGNSSSGSIDNISIKEATNADFTFTRNDAGTRVNASGNIESIGVDLPRIDYFGGSGSLLLEPEATNTATDSNDFSQGTIFVSSSDASTTNGLILTANATTSPEGLTNASKLQIGTTNQAFNRLRYAGAVTVSGNINTLSIFAKKGSGVDWFGIFADGIDASSRGWFDLENGVLGSKSAAVVNHKMEDYGNGWYRCSMSFTTSVDTNGVVSFVITDGNGNTSYSGDLTDHHFIYGLQAESHATREYATSYIPTSGDIQTRAADSSTDAGSSDLISSTEGVLYAELSTVLNTDSKRISLSDGNSLNRVEFGFDIASNSLRIIVKSNDNDIINSQEVISSDITNFIKVAIKYKSGDTKVFVNGNSVGNTSTVSFSNIGTMDRLNLSTHTSSAYHFQGKVKCVAVYKEALTDAELTCLTAPNISRIFNERVLADGGIIESLDCIESVEFRFTDYYSRVINNGGIIESLECVSL